jgi:hypothetical protein
MKKIIGFIILLVAFGNTKTFAQADTTCAGSSGNIYDIVPSAGSTFSWSLKNSLGTIVPISGRTDSILITYGSTAGIDTLRMVETGPSGCLGDTMKLAVIILPNITAVISGTDSICVNNLSANRLRVTFTGTSPWNITYTDGTTPVSITGITANPYIFNSPIYSTTGIRTFSLTNASATGSCPAVLSGSGNITVFPKPVSSGISHY